MTVWFTSDLHFGHRVAAQHRGFGDSESETQRHDEILADNWYKAVRPSDQVWVLGDLAIGNPAYALSILKDLPGEKHLIAGNHDHCHPMHRNAHRKQRQYLDVFESVQAFARRSIEGERVLLSHFPYYRDRDEPRHMQYRLRNEGLWLLHGHTHGSERVTRRLGSFIAQTTNEIHVGVDAWGMAPVALHTIAELMNGAST